MHFANCLITHLLHSTGIFSTLILMFRITRAGVGVGNDGARDDGQEQTCPLCSPLHSNNHHHQCPLLETILPTFPLKVVLANPLSPLVHDDSDSLYDTEGSNVGRSILGTEATTTIAQVDFQKQSQRRNILIKIPPQIIKSSTSSLLLSAFNAFILITGGSNLTFEKNISKKSTKNINVLFFHRPDQDFPSWRAADVKTRLLEQVSKIFV